MYCSPFRNIIRFNHITEVLNFIEVLNVIKYILIYMIISISYVNSDSNGLFVKDQIEDFAYVSFFKCFFHVLQTFLSVCVVVLLLLQRPGGWQTIYLFHPRRKCSLNLSPFYPFILRPGKEQASYITHVLMQHVIGLRWQREGAPVWLSAIFHLSLTFHFYPNSRPLPRSVLHSDSERGKSPDLGRVTKKTGVHFSH